MGVVCALRRHGTTALVAASVAALTAGGPAVAGSIVDFARNSDKVDGKHAVGAGASAPERAGKLVATNSAGRLPNNIIAQAPDSQKLAGQNLSEVVASARDGLQEQVTGTCQPSQVMTAIAADGSVTCDSPYARTFIVQAGSTPNEGGAHIGEALYAIQQDGLQGVRTQLVLEPGVYNLGTGIDLPQNIDIRGAGRTATTITGTGSSSDTFALGAAVIRAYNASDNTTTIRDLTIEKTGAAGEYATALSDGGRPMELIDVRLSVTGGAHVAGLRVDGGGSARPRLRDVEIAAFSNEPGAVVDGIGIGAGHVVMTGGRVDAWGDVVSAIRIDSVSPGDATVTDAVVAVSAGSDSVAARIVGGNFVGKRSEFFSPGDALQTSAGGTASLYFSLLGGAVSGTAECGGSYRGTTLLDSLCS
jgi:hypothetical protein